jgi:DNA-binding GntR family transcriptional regulator
MDPRRTRSALVARLGGRLDAPRSPNAGSPASTVLDELRRCLLDGEVPPGSPIPVDEVAAVFGVSRIPVREALKTLIGEGLVEHRPNQGYRVAVLTPAELAEIYLVREVLETAALRAAVVRAGPEDDAEAVAAHQALGGALGSAQRRDSRVFHRESRRFHRALVAPCGMRRLLGMLESAWNLTEPLRPMAHLTDPERDRLHADHQRLLEAFLARDREGLLAATGMHYDRLRSVLDALPRDTGLFADS